MKLFCESGKFGLFGGKLLEKSLPTEDREFACGRINTYIQLHLKLYLCKWPESMGLIQKAFCDTLYFKNLFLKYKAILTRFGNDDKKRQCS